MPNTDDTLQRIAHNVKTARIRSGLSLDELGRRAQVSKGSLVSLEKAQGNPNLATLVRLADTLNVSVSALMEGPGVDPIRITSDQEGDPLWTGDNGSEARLMLTANGGTPVEIWRWRLEPGEAYQSHPHQAGVVETISITEGAMVLTIEDTDHHLSVGQTAAFAADRPHAYRGAGEGTCRLIMTVHLPA